MSWQNSNPPSESFELRSTYRPALKILTQLVHRSRWEEAGISWNLTKFAYYDQLSIDLGYINQLRSLIFHDPIARVRSNFMHRDHAKHLSLLKRH